MGVINFLYYQLMGGCRFFLPQVNIVKVKYTGGVYHFILVASSSFLKKVHITKLQVIVAVKLVTKAGKKPVLVKVIVYNVLAKIHKYFVVNHIRKRGLFVMYADRYIH